MATVNNKKRTQTGKVSGRKKTNKKAKSGIGREAAVLITLALSVIFFIANFGVGGVIGAGISSFFFGLFGIIAYIFPIVLFIGTIFAIANKKNAVARIKLAAGIVFIILLCTLIQLISGSHYREWTPGDYYINSAKTHLGGGMFGGTLAKLLCLGFGTIGAYVFDVVLMIIAVVVITERSFLNGVKKGSRKVYDTARNDMEQYREDAKEKKALRQEQKEEKRVRRMEKKAYGVTYDTEIKPGEDIFEFKPAPPEELEVHELERTDENVKAVPYDIHPYENREIQHYEEEQLPIYDSVDGEEEEYDVVIVPEPECEPPEDEPVRETEEYSSVEDFSNIIDTELVNEEFEKQQADTVKKTPSKPKTSAKYVFPPKKLLKTGQKNTSSANNDLEATKNKLRQTMASFGVNVRVGDASCGPAVTRYEIYPEQGVKVSRIVSLADDIKLSLAAADIRIEAPIPGKSAVGIEVPNKETTGVLLGDLISTAEFRNSQSKIAFAVGKDISGHTTMADIEKMPHVLIAGATGSGKSVCINTIVMSILYKARPDEVKLIMIDPKVVELSVYNGIPHLLIPVVTEPKKAASALNWAVAEMNERYKKFAAYQVRNLKGYNEKVEQISDIEDENKPEKMPQIVIIVDELADLMMVASKEVEDAIVRLSQLARAAGIHLVIATQRPSVNVITGLIKANVPSRMAFAVSSGVDSRTILDMNGAEKLLGKGDMLFFPYGYPKPVRVQGAFVSDEEVQSVVEYIKEHNHFEEEKTDITEQMSNPAFEESQAFGQGDDKDCYFAEAGKFIIEKERASIGMLQRVYKIGFNRAARIMDQLCDAGVVGPEEGTKPRKVLMKMEEFEEYLKNNRK